LDPIPMIKARKRRIIKQIRRKENQKPTELMINTKTKNQA
jgi:hypothetical protein